MSLICAYLLSIVFGALVSGPVSSFLFWRVRKRFGRLRNDRVWWIPALLSIVERTICTTLAVFAPKLVAPLIGAWVALKVAGGWGLFKDTSALNRANYMVGLIVTALSIGLGVDLIRNSNWDSTQRRWR